MTCPIIRLTERKPLIAAIKSAVANGEPFILPERAYAAIAHPTDWRQRSFEKRQGVKVLRILIREGSAPGGICFTGRTAGTCVTVFCGPANWTVERLAGHVSNLWLEMEGSWGAADTMKIHDQLVEVHSVWSVAARKEQTTTQ
jgi:hypothetical protein